MICLRQTRQNAAQLIQHDLLHRRIRIELIARQTDTDRCVATTRVHHFGFGRQETSVIATSLDVIAIDQRDAGVNPRKHEAEVRGRGARRAADGRVVDVEPDAVRHVGRAGVDKGGGDGRGQVGVDLHVSLHRCVPGGLGAGSAAEGDTWDAFLGGFRRGAHGSGQDGCYTQVGTDVRTGDGDVWGTAEAGEER
jgi:hypothetical protein